METYLDQREQAAEHLLAGLAAGDDLDSDYLRWHAQMDLANLAMKNGQVDEAAARAEQALKLAYLLRDPRLQAQTLSSRMVDAAVRQGDVEAALGYCLEALRLERQMGRVPAAAQDANEAAYLAMALGRLTDARRLAEDASRAELAMDGKPGSYLHSLGEVLQLQGDLEGAIAIFEQILDRGEDDRAVLFAHLSRGWLYQAGGDLTRAFAHYRSAVHRYSFRKGAIPLLYLAAATAAAGRESRAEQLGRLAMEHLRPVQLLTPTLMQVAATVGVQGDVVYAPSLSLEALVQLIQEAAAELP